MGSWYTQLGDWAMRVPIGVFIAAMVVFEVAGLVALGWMLYKSLRVKGLQ